MVRSCSWLASKHMSPRFRPEKIALRAAKTHKMLSFKANSLTRAGFSH